MRSQRRSRKLRTIWIFFFNFKFQVKTHGEVEKPKEEPKAKDDSAPHEYECSGAMTYEALKLLVYEALRTMRRRMSTSAQVL